MFNYSTNGTISIKTEVLMEMQQSETRILQPENKGEVLVMLQGKAEIICFDKSRAYTVTDEQALIILPRGRGMTINAVVSSKMKIIKTDPLGMVGVVNGMLTSNQGVFHLDPVKLGMSIERWLSENMAVSNLIQYKQTCGELLRESIGQIIDREGQISVKELYESFGVSKSTLEQQFTRKIGLSPKECCRIQRLNYFLKCQWENPDRSLTELAYQCGYYDQSHLIKDFQYFMQTSPRKFLTSRINRRNSTTMLNRAQA